jgi:signal transduction histidine kinase
MSKDLAYQNKVSQQYPALYDRISSTFYELTEHTHPKFKLAKIPNQNEFNLEKSTTDDYLELCKIYADSALIFSEVNNDNRTKLSSLNILGAYSRQKQNYDQAIGFFRKAIELAEQINFKIDIPNYYINIARTYFIEKQFQKAIEYGLKGYLTAVNLNILIYKSTSASILRSSYLEINDYKNALEYQTIEASTREEMNSQKNWNNISELGKKYQTEQKEKEIEFQRKLLELKSVEILWKNIVLIFMLIVCVIIVIGILYIQRNNKKLKKANQKIANQNEEIQAQTRILETTNEKLVELDHFKEGMICMIVHDLKNPLNSILNTDHIERIKQAGKQMLIMVLNLLDVQKFEDAKMKLELQNSLAYNIAEKAYNQVIVLMEEKNITFKNQINKTLCIKTDPEILERVFVNLLTNAIKYTPNNGNISIMNELMNEKLVDVKPDFIPSFFHSFILFKVSDTGQGIPADKHHLVFEKFGQVEAKKSGSVSSTGLGLTFCKLAVEAHGGQIGVESEVGNGTTFWFTVPTGTEVASTLLVEKEYPKTETFNISEEDKKTLLVLLPQFRELEVYEVSSIRNLLKNKDITENCHCRIWVNEMQKVLRSGNAERYTELLNLIENKNA